MNYEDRMAMNVGRLVIQLEQKQAAIDDLIEKILSMEREITELKDKKEPKDAGHE